MEPECSICGKYVSKCDGHPVPTRPSYEELVEALDDLNIALRTDHRQQTVADDTVEYHLDGYRMYHALNKVRSLLSRIRTPEKGGSNG